MLSTRCAWRRLACAAALFCATTAPGCSGNGGGDGGSAPVLPWGRFRRDTANSGVSIGAVARNPGQERWRLDLGAQGGITDSTPVIGLNDTIYIGTERGLLAVDRLKGTPRYGGPLASCEAAGVDIGPINGSPAVTVNNDVIVGNDSGYVFLIHDDGSGLDCKWAFSTTAAQPTRGVGLPWIRSSPIAVTDPLHSRLLRVFLGSLAGTVQTLNGNGTEQWRFQGSDPSFGPITSSPASDGTSLYVTAPDGALYAVDAAGRLRWRAAVGDSQASAELLASPLVGTLSASVYAVGAVCELGGSSCKPVAGQVTAFLLDGTFRWRFDSLDGLPLPPVQGSPALVLQSVDERLPQTPVPPDSSDPAPTPTPTRLVPVSQDVVYLLDSAGTVYALKGSSGRPFDIFEPAVTSTPTATPTPLSTGGPRRQETRVRGPEGAPATVKRSVVRLQTQGDVTASPAISGDLFVLFGTTAGRLYAVRVDFERTGPCTQGCPSSEWLPAESAEESDGTAGAFVVLRDAGPVRSSPITDRDGTIYVTADRALGSGGFLYAIGTEPQ